MKPIKTKKINEPVKEPSKFDLQSFDIVAEQREKLRQLFPEAITESGKIDFDRLKLTLGETVDTGKERYGMNWPGKADCFKTIQKPSMATLIPARDESVNFDTTENLIIEGDNLEVLKLLQKSYLGKVKMIYIDPPYNTGNDFIYPDNYSESLETYLRYTGQVDEEGRKFSTNTEADGRFHSKWLNMMYPRLFLARNLLREDGVIFISIDDCELGNLVKLCNEIFGEDNFVGTFCWKRRISSALAERLVSTDHEYVLSYQKQNFTALGTVKSYEAYKNPDNDPRGPWRLDNLTVGMTAEQRPNQFYDLIEPKTGRRFSPNPNRVWCYIPETMNKAIAEGRIVFPEDGKRRPLLKRFKNELKSDVDPISTWMDQVDINTQATRELQSLLEAGIQIYPKPKSLITTLLAAATQEDDIVLDFFAGSGTTAQAVLELNQKDGEHRKFILVQLPEPTERKDFSTIADITKERVRRVIEKLHTDENGKLRLDDTTKQDLGFKVFKHQSSNFKAWNTEQVKDEAELAKQLNLHVEHLVEGRSQEDVLYELLLKSGFPLDTPIEKLTLASKTVFSIGDGLMLVCLEDELTLEALRAMADKKPERVVCLDAGFANNDQLKTNAVQIMKSKGVTKFQTV